MRLAFAAVLLIAAPLAGCAPSMIPGTDIKDSPDARQIIDVITAYRGSLESRNVDGIMKLVSKTFFENCGTPEGGDDYDYAGLEQKLKSWAEKTKIVRAALEVKAINVTKDQAQVQYFFDVNYEIPGPDNTTQWKRETDTKEMTLKLEGSMWRIISGI
jgi:hypothetical protein